MIHRVFNKMEQKTHLWQGGNVPPLGMKDFIDQFLEKSVLVLA